MNINLITDNMNKKKFNIQMHFLLSEGLQNFFQQLALKDKIRSTEFAIKKLLTHLLTFFFLKDLE